MVKNNFPIARIIGPKFDSIREKYNALCPALKILVWVLGILIIGGFMIWGYISMRLT